MWLNIFQYLLAILIYFLSSDKLSSMCSFCLLILSFVILIYKNVLPKQINSCHELIYAYFKSLRFPIFFLCIYVHVCDFSVGSMIEKPPAMQEMWVYSWVWKILWERKCHPTSLFLPGKSLEQSSLAGYPLWGFKRVEHELAIKHTTNTHTQTHAYV